MNSQAQPSEKAGAPQAPLFCETQFTPLPLGEATLNKKYKVVKLGHTPLQSQQLRALGLSEFHPIIVMEKPGSSTRLIANGGARVALDISIANTITVREACNG
ncbi:ferrous iron transport protein A [Pseudovibrio flavus]|uniref:ferrous iron transport protein A n=1 Tax=Pseudovibrio flavus TaxID=2529854 RepID=UPI00211C7628|nr:ferrous iron transport protein A [Pseudovibrio flavus]